MPHKGIATLSFALALCFLLLTHFDPQFFMLHFYESVIYLVLVLMLFYFHERWAYMVGILAPAGWLALSFASGGLSVYGRQFVRLFHANGPDFAASFIGGIAAFLSVAMIFFCGYRWRREFPGIGRELRTFVVSFGIVSAYYAVLVLWFWRSVTSPLAP
jgi:hypothetical protein